MNNRPEQVRLSVQLDHALARLSRQDRVIEQLEKAATEQEVIGQATGILMERYTITTEQAGRFLARASADAGTALTQIAAQSVQGDKITL